ncbi:MAG: hypothetical protein AMJ95_03255 [Omnitrophica WOR_2 bacterium SM23_72]|nr:MAG: hypothetical protein AMJ95_03255 [Omnitrophica WOR_2 bacterium SM23_72]
MKKIVIFLISMIFLVQLYGCVALLAGAAGGAGTAAWLSGKLSQEVNVSFDRALKAARSGLESMKLNVTKETVKEDVAQLMSNYSDGRTIWVDVRRVTDSASRIDVRVGATGDKEAAQKVLDQIRRYL